MSAAKDEWDERAAEDEWRRKQLRKSEQLQLSGQSGTSQALRMSKQSRISR